jgi:dinuclear metal center YbgI/SA1388 family protein
VSSVTVADIIARMENLAPPRLAEKWDNVGLQVGRMDWPVRTVSIALDPLPQVVADACASQVDLLITHHPLTLSAFKTIDFDSPIGNVIEQAAQNHLAIFAAHTNLDSAQGGINDLLASRLALNNLVRLVPAVADDSCKLVIYAPVESEQAVLEALLATGAGTIGAYTGCSFRARGTGTFKPGPSSQPYSGTRGALSHVDEIRIETVVERKQLARVIAHVRQHHPYETMAYDVYPLVADKTTEGLGCVGDFAHATQLIPLARQIKKALGLPSIKVVGRPDLPIKRAAVCSGSGSSLLPVFLASDADVFISGDWRYHDARRAEADKRALIDIGHFSSEHIIVKELAQRLQGDLDEAGLSVIVKACELEKDPFYIL